MRSLVPGSVPPRFGVFWGPLVGGGPDLSFTLVPTSLVLMSVLGNHKVAGLLACEWWIVVVVVGISGTNVVAAVVFVVVWTVCGIGGWVGGGGVVGVYLGTWLGSWGLQVSRLVLLDPSSVLLLMWLLWWWWWWCFGVVLVEDVVLVLSLVLWMFEVLAATSPAVCSISLLGGWGVVPYLAPDLCNNLAGSSGLPDDHHPGT